MILSMSEQAALFFSTVLVGAAVGLFYDLFRVMRRTVPHGRVTVQLQDAFFWVAATVLVFYFMLQRNQGDVRWFLLLGTAIGMVLYFVGVSRWVVRGLVAVVEFVKRVLAAALGLLLFPLRLLTAWLSPPVKKYCGIGRKKLRAAKRYGKIRMQQQAKRLRIFNKKV